MITSITPQQTFRIDEGELAREIGKAFHTDASESVFIARELLNVRAQVFPEHKALSLVPVKSDIHPGDTHYTYGTYSMTGSVGLIAGESETARSAEVTYTEETPVGFVSFGGSYKFDFQEARSAQRAGKNLEARKMTAVRRAHSQKLNEIITGAGAANTEFGKTLYGLCNLTGTTTYAIPNGMSGVKTWPDKTPDEVLLDMSLAVSEVVTSTNDVEHPDTLLLPLSRYEHITQRRMGDGSDTTILKFFLATNPHIKQVIPWYALEQAGAGSTKRMVAYHRSPEKLEALLPVEFEQFAPDVKPTAVRVQCHTRTGGVVAYYPKSICYADGI
jgi:hypothetical protein